MKSFIKKVKKQAKKDPKRIVFPDAIEERTLQATEVIQKQGIANLVLIGSPAILKANAERLKLKIKWNKLEVVDPKKNKLKEEYSKDYFELRKHKGITKEDAKKTMEDRNYLGTMMVHKNYVDGMVTGTLSSTADSIRPALQIIKTNKKFHKVSGVYFLILDNRVLLFADTAITIEPNSYDLVDIAIDTAETAKKFGLIPKVAFLSFSTKGSADHPSVDKVREAVAMMKYKRPDIISDGELQLDAAIVKSVAGRKCPDSPIKGEANVLIFPNLSAGNIAYKLTERLAKAKAIGPILQGLKKPINDLSRGCDYKDIVNITAFTVYNCQQND